MTKIALDKSRPLDANFTIRAVYGAFENLNPVWIQLWEPTFDDPNTFLLVWQQKFQPLSGNGSSEAVGDTQATNPIILRKLFIYIRFL